VGWWTAGDWAGAAFSAIPWSWGYWPYYNPYYVGPVIVGSATIDYSQPIVVAQAASPPVGQAGLTAGEQATPLLDAARDAFMQGDYKTALASGAGHCASARRHRAARVPRPDALRAGRYKEAAATDYAVLSAGPGWDWTTLSASIRTWTSTRSNSRLGAVRKSEPGGVGCEIPAGRSLPDLRNTDAAAAQLKEVVRLNPKDSYPPNCSIAFPHRIPPSRRRPATGGADEAGRCVEPRGNWTATRADSATIKLALAGDGKFTWAVDQNGKPQQFQRHVYRCRQPPCSQAG